MRCTVLLTTLSLLLGPTVVRAQVIERMKMTDNDLSCQQVFGEIGQMDALIAKANAAAAAPVPVAMPAAAPAQDPNVAGQAAAGVAGAVAQQALATGVGRSGFGALGGLGGMFGGLIQSAANAQAQQAQVQQQQQQAQAQVQAQQVALQQQQNAVMAQQAQGRKEHLTSLFLSKGCKLSEVQR